MHLSTLLLVVLVSAANYHAVAGDDDDLPAQCHEDSMDVDFLGETICGKTCTYTSWDEEVLVGAWGTLDKEGYRPSPGGCVLKFESYQKSGMAFHMFPHGTYNHISDCNVHLNIYSSNSANIPRQTLLKSYSCDDNSMESDKEYTTHDSYLMIELVNPYRSTAYDFTLFVTIHYESYIGWVAALCVIGGLSVAFTIMYCKYGNKDRCLTRLRGGQGRQGGSLTSTGSLSYGAVPAELDRKVSSTS